MMSYIGVCLYYSVRHHQKLFLYFHVANEGLYYQCAPKEITEEVKTFIQIQIPKIKTTDLFNLSSENRTVSYEETECRTECSDGKNSDNMGTNFFPIYEDLSQSSDRCYLDLNNDYVHLCAQEETDDMTKSNSTSQCNQNDYTLQNMFTSCPRNASDHPLYTVEHDDLSRAHGSTPLSSLHERDTTTLHTPSTSLDMSSVTSQGSNPLPHVALDRIFSSSVWSSGVHELQHGETNADRRIKGKYNLARSFVCVGFTAQSTLLGHVERGQCTSPHVY